MSNRTLRRAAERQARKAEANLSPTTLTAAQLVTTLTGEAANPDTPAFDPKPRTATLPAILRTVSEAQFAANRTNAQRSTGPTSEAGKAASSRNHTSHGLTVGLRAISGPFKVLPGEDQAAFDETVALYSEEWKPATATELDLIDRLATYSWLRRRATNLIDHVIAEGGGTLRPEDLRQFEVLNRYQTAHQRAFNKALADFMRLRAFQMRQRKDEALLAQRAEEVQAKERIRFESQKLKVAEHAVKMEILNLKLEAQKQRSQRASKPATAVQLPVKTPDIAQTQTAIA